MAKPYDPNTPGRRSESSRTPPIPDEGVLSRPGSKPAEIDEQGRLHPPRPGERHGPTSPWAWAAAQASAWDAAVSMGPGGIAVPAHGPHAGRGPKGYTRSDARIYEDVCDTLTDDPHLDPSGVDVGVEAGEVTLSGEVASRAEKWRIETAVAGVRGVRDVHNALRVRER